MTPGNGQTGGGPPAGGQTITSRDGDTGGNVAGAHPGGTGAPGIYCNRYEERAIDYKACRALFKRTGIKARTFDALCILWLYLHRMNKDLTGCTLKEVAGWSGYGRRHEEQINYRFGLLLDLQALEKFPYNGGYRYLITRKGEYYLELWEQLRQEFITKLNERARIAAAKVDGRTLRKRHKGRFIKE